MLFHLRQVGKFDGIAGLIVGRIAEIDERQGISAARSTSFCPTISATPPFRWRRMRRSAMRPTRRSEERRVGKDVSVRVDLGGRRIVTKKTGEKPQKQNMKR